MKNRVALGVSIDKEVMEFIVAEHEQTRVSKSVIVNDILKNHYEIITT